MKEYTVLSPTAILGYGFPEESFEFGLSKNPDLIACDAGSTDPGPYYLGSGIPFTNRNAVKRDLKLMLNGACKLGIPMVIGTAGGCGAKPHVSREIDIIREIAKEDALSFSMAVIWADFDKDFLLTQVKDGKISPLGPTSEVSDKDILDSTNIVAQMGIDPIVSALDAGAQIVLCGRCYDPAAFAAPAVRAGYSLPLAVHMGKILECAAIAATPGSGSDCMIGYIGEDYFRVEPCNKIRKCTTMSVASHTLYEKSDPCMLPGPGGVLDLNGCTFTQEGERCVRVSGSAYHKSSVPTVKLEGARIEGYRTISVCGNRDSVFHMHLDEIIDGVKETVARNLASCGFTYRLDFIVYGRDGVMGALEPTPVVDSHEIGIVIDAVADTQENANTVCSMARSTMLHYGYEGRIATAGNLAFPFSPSDVKVGPVYTFSLYHLLETTDTKELFPRTDYCFKEGVEQ